MIRILSISILLLFSFATAQTNKNILVDFGPNDVTNGNITQSPDINGNYWNNVTDGSTSADTVFFVDNANNQSGIFLTIKSFIAKNGILNGGLLNPDSSLLGEFAIPTATQDYFYHETSGSFSMGGLDKSKEYIFHFFATRNADKERITQYSIIGDNSEILTLQTSGKDLGGTGYHGNTQTIAVSERIKPDADGNILITLSTVTGGFCYLGVMKVVEVEPIPQVESTGLLIDFGPNDIVNGNITPSPDINGNYWNNVTDIAVNAISANFVDNANNATDIFLTVTSAFAKNGIQNGGLLEPDSTLLGEFAIPTATQDYFFQTGSASFVVSGLDKTKSYVFQFFGTRNAAEVRTTQYELQGSNSNTITLQTSGTDLGGSGYHGNNQTIAASSPIIPDENGNISITVSKIAGSFCYLGLMKIIPQELEEKISLENPGFETGDLAGWTIYPPGNITSAKVVSEFNKSGLYSLKLSGDSVSLSQMISGISGHDYLLSGYFYIPSSDTLKDIQSAGLELCFYDKDYNLLTKNNSVSINSSTKLNKWNKVSALATVPGNAEFIKTTILWNGIQSDGSVFVDDIKLEIYNAVVSTCTAYPQFVNERSNSNYMTTGFDDTNWSSVSLPDDAKNTLYGNRTYWFRKEIDVPQNLAADSLFVLTLGKIDGADAVWFNGILIKESDFQNTNRKYLVPDSLVLQGLNHISMQTGFLNGSSFFDANIDMQLQSNQNNTLLISGEWKYQQGIVFNNDNVVNEEFKIAIMGSSVALGQGAANQLGYAKQYDNLLESRLSKGVGEDWNVVNISIGGNKTTDLMNRYESDLLPQCALYVVYGLSLGNEGIHEQGEKAFNQFRDNMQILIQKARDYNIIPIVVNCYTRNDFTQTDYEYTKQMNLLIHQWDVPSVNVLGAIDDGTGKWVTGFFADGWHPNTAGHKEMFHTFVPSLFDALDKGIPLPEKINGTSYRMENLKTISPLEYNLDDIVHPFTISFDIKTASVGAISGIKEASGNALIKIDSSGYLTYISTAGDEIKSDVSIIDNEWHKVTLSHNYARQTTFLYLDTIQVGSISERLEIKKIVLGGSGFFDNLTSPESAEYREWLFYRSSLNDDEVNAMNVGNLLKSSLELYAPLDEEGKIGNDPFVNLAQSTTIVIQNITVSINGEQDNLVPHEFALYNNYPNPFNPTTSIKFSVAETEDVKIEVFNILGQRMLTLVNENKPAGNYNIKLNAENLASGVYIYMMQAGKFVQTKKMLLMK